MKMKKVIFSIIFLSLFISISSLLYYLHYKWHNPGCQYQELITKIAIKPNTSFNTIISILHKHKIIKHPLLFKLSIKIFGNNKPLKAGIYNLSPCWSYSKIFEILSKGKEKLFPIVIPEGLPWWKVANIFQKNGFITFDDFAKEISNPIILKEFNIPAKNVEGYLFPSTYFLSKTKKYTAREIIVLMLSTFKKETKKIFNNYSPSKIHKFVILASLIEKETALSWEKPIISGVFWNRLKRNMLLQCDPTVIYGIGKNFDGNLKKKHLRDKTNLYNTYIYKGLPPGPICSPGLEALKAAIHPKKHDYLYFVAKGDNSHFFSKTLKGHTSAVRKFQLKR